ncbi:trypsin-like serine protease [Amycolatopsis acidiphila]|uniref:Trypsin-like serine protease n=1 Tax=Amycolatopsis acidiphila TaxID=715473 RepID=A0A558ADG8_9PSEU|nr:trypsin-like serine protease [Amycolatopsis acidiphila]TVT22311.1 trypsin-like serine protease [Amycolatopsis acidiphila]UIJ57972.1 trypsin-like serine protease [Amycolatopsis acidiphila]GHG70794.1 hypothetical protein GCM10017788_32240 [Amycolatopsis acidiphila]
MGDVLQRGNFAVLAGDKCSPRLGGVVDQTSMLCAEGTTPGTTVCPGDSGGPLMADLPGRPVQVGITSFAGEVEGLTCGQPSPAGFTDVGRVREWALSPGLALAPVPEGVPVIKGEAKADGTLLCEQPDWRGRPTAVTTEWYRQNTDSTGFVFFTPIPGATTDRMTVPADVAGTSVDCLVTAYSGGGKVTVLADAIPIPAQ